ncbi:MAG: BON domain-containing protein [Pirellulales bacterium]
MGDIALENLVSETLGQHPHLNRRWLRFETDAGRVTLKGTVSSYYQKQMAQEAVRRVHGVCAVENQLQVAWPELMPVS